MERSDVSQRLSSKGPTVGRSRRPVLSSPDHLQRQRCKVCWHADGFDFQVTDEVWLRVLPKHLHDHVVCLRCFDDFAFAAKVDYSRHLTTLHFSGRQVAAIFTKAG